MVKVKVCGTTNLEDALFCEKQGANALGFIFYPQSKRYIKPEDAKTIIRKLSPFTTKVGVFVNHTREEIRQIAEITGIQVIQLHGDEEESFFQDSPLPLIKAYRIKEAADFKAWNFPEHLTPLFDTYSSAAYGGTGVSFRYEDIPADLCKRSIIAGGVSLENIERVIALNPMGIDLVSSLEITPGKKNFTKTELFFNKLYSIQEKQ
ncbi:MAG: phosphoribosylanthranilate isomerase [Ignavibacteriaceae bacterium]|nr:phosphoribosylanthranilate isomerase [Ignavibacteriaceae bacterium]